MDSSDYLKKFVKNQRKFRYYFAGESKPITSLSDMICNLLDCIEQINEQGDDKFKDLFVKIIEEHRDILTHDAPDSE